MAEVTTTGVLQRIKERLATPDPLLRRWADILVDDIHGFFSREEDPTGRPWDPLSPSTKKKVNPGAGILQDSFALFNSIDRAITKNAAVVGPTRALEYELIQHLGGATGPPSPNVIPARPYVGISQEGIEAVRREYLEYWFNVAM